MAMIPARDIRTTDLITTSLSDYLSETVPVTRVVTIGDRTTIHRCAAHWTQPQAHIFPADQLIPVHNR